MAPLYGHGLAERRLGSFLRRQNRAEFAVSTKFGRLPMAENSASQTADKMVGIFESPLPFSLLNNYTYDGIMRSVEDGLQRLRLPRIDILHIHNIDPNNHTPDKLNALFEQCMSERYRAQEQLRRLHSICAVYGVGLRAAALQFPLWHASVSSVVSGMRTAQEVPQCAADFKSETPSEIFVDRQSHCLITPDLQIPD